MQLKQFFFNVNQSLFSGNILKLFFSYNGVINRTQYITAIIMLLMIPEFFMSNFLSYMATIFLLIYCLTALIQKRARSFKSTGTFYIIANITFYYALIFMYCFDHTLDPIVEVSVIKIPLIANIILIFQPSKLFVGEQKRSFLTRFPIIFTILVFSGIFVMFGLKYKYEEKKYKQGF